MGNTEPRRARQKPACPDLVSTQIIQLSLALLSPLHKKPRFFQTTCSSLRSHGPGGVPESPKNHFQTNCATEIPNPLRTACAKWSGVVFFLTAEPSAGGRRGSDQKQSAGPHEWLRTANKAVGPEHRPRRTLECDHARLTGKGGYEQAHTAPAGVKP